MEGSSLSAAKIDAWIALVRAQKRLLSKIETALKSEGMPPLTWYDVLLELHRAEPKGLRPMDLEGRLLLPQYGISRLLDRMAKSGLLERRKAPDDGRGQVIRITQAGSTLRAQMWPVYAAALGEALASKLSEDEAETLRHLLWRLN